MDAFFSHFNTSLIFINVCITTTFYCKDIQHSSSRPFTLLITLYLPVKYEIDSTFFFAIAYARSVNDTGYYLLITLTCSFKK